MAVLSLNEQVKKGTMAVKALRLRRLKNGLPFMINVKGIGDKLCYMEYPDGSIHLVKQSANGSDFETLNILSHSEILKLKNRFNLD